MTLDKIYHAAFVLKDIIRKTDVIAAPELNPDADIILKTENLQVTGSFKVRGAAYKISQLSEEEKARGVIACSAGNHAQGVALAATKAGAKSLICLPDNAPISKIEATKKYGADVCLVPGVYDDAYNKALELRDSEGYTFVHPFNDEDVIAGQGTIGLEILEQVPDVDAVIVPVGGGGLISGVAYAIKALNPNVKVYGVQASGAPSMVKSVKEGKIKKLASVTTIADGIAVKAPGDITVDIINRLADGVVTVTESEIANAILLLIERCKQVVEPSGATSLAAVLSGKIDVKGKRVVCVLSGGNIDVSFIQSIIERGLVARHRRIKFTAIVVDRPGSLVQLLQVIADAGANILAVEHDKLRENLNPNETSVHISCEVGGKEHGQALIDKLLEKGYPVEMD